MSEQKLKPITIPGIQDLNNFEAESCVGGAFTVNRYLRSGRETRNINSNFTRLDLTDSVTGGFDLRNTSLLEGENFTLVYRNNAGREVTRERIFGAGRPRLYTRGRHLNDGRSVTNVEIFQDAAPGPSIEKPSPFLSFGVIS